MVWNTAPNTAPKLKWNTAPKLKWNTAPKLKCHTVNTAAKKMLKCHTVNTAAKKMPELLTSTELLRKNKPTLWLNKLAMMTWTLTQKTRNSCLLLTQHAENPKIQMTKCGVNASAISSADALIWMMKTSHLPRKVAIVTMTLASLHQRKRQQMPLLTLAENPKIQMTKSGVNASANSSVDALIWMICEDNTTPVQLVTDVIQLTTPYNWPMG